MTNHEKIRKHLHRPSMSFGYVLGKRTLYWPSITTPYRWSGMTNHELLNVRFTGPA